MANFVNADSFAVSLTNILGSYNVGAQKAVNQCIKAFAQRLLEDVKETAPVGRRGGRRGGRKIDKGRPLFADTARLNFTGNSIGGSQFVLYFSGAGSGLAHLLEHGHVGRDGNFVHGSHFIQKAFNKEEPQLMSELASALGSIDVSLSVDSGAQRPGQSPEAAVVDPFWL